MNLTLIEAALTPSFRRVACLGLFGLFAVSACSDDEVVPAPQPELGVSVQTLDGYSPEGPVALRCDGTLAVSVALSTSIENVGFVLSPANACGKSTRCGYIRVEALSAADDVLTQVDSVTTVGVLELALEQRAELAAVRVRLISGVDQTPILMKDGTEVASMVTPTFTLQEDCPAADGSGGGGQGGEASDGGSSPGGAGGAPASAGVGGAPDPVAGAGAGGSPTETGAGGIGGVAP